MPWSLYLVQLVVVPLDSGRTLLACICLPASRYPSVYLVICTSSLESLVELVARLGARPHAHSCLSAYESGRHRLVVCRWWNVSSGKGGRLGDADAQYTFGQLRYGAERLARLAVKHRPKAKVTIWQRLQVALVVTDDPLPAHGMLAWLSLSHQRSLSLWLPPIWHDRRTSHSRLTSEDPMRRCPCYFCVRERCRRAAAHSAWAAATLGLSSASPAISTMDSIILSKRSSPTLVRHALS